MIVALCKKVTNTGPLSYFVVQVYINCGAEQFWTPGGVEIL